MHLALSDYVPDDEPRFQATDALVEATDFERTKLWQENALDSEWYSPKMGKPTLDWKQDLSGRLCEVGAVVTKKSGQDRRPISVCFTWATINGKLICFWEATSRFVDHNIIEAWFERAFRPQIPKTNATNFHNVLR